MAETLLVEDVVMEEDLLFELEEDPDPGDEASTQGMTPGGLELPELVTPPPELTGADGNSNYMGGPRARVYQPPQRKKPKSKRKKRTGMRRRRITLPGMTPDEK